ncbi:MAG: 50S ribosomal protein L1 [Patescibacteria group bacterium]
MANKKAPHSKRMTALQTIVDKNKTYTLDEAVALVKQTSTTKFDSSVELHANLGIDVKKSDQQIRSTVVLPHGTGKSRKVAAFVNANTEGAAKEAGADSLLDEEGIKKIKDTGKYDFDIAVTTPDMMPKLASIAKVLGPKGLMPSPKTDTVGTDLKKMIGELKRGKAAFKNDDTGNIHQIVGKASFSADQLKENITALTDTIRRIKPNSSKGTYIKALYLTSSMGPSIKLEIPQ